MSFINLLLGPKAAVAPLVSDAPILNNITLRMGERTTPGDSSTVKLANIPDFVDPAGAPVAFFRTFNVVPLGGGLPGDLGGLLATNTAAATARTPNPTKGNIQNLDTVTLHAAGYTWQVVGVSADGVESAPATVTWEVVPNAFTVGDAQTSVGMSSRLTTDTGGYTWLIATGVAHGYSLALQHMKPVGRTTVTYADIYRPTRIGSVDFQSSERMDLVSLGIGGAVATKVLGRIVGAGQVCADNTMTDCYPLGASIADINLALPNVQAGVKLSDCTNFIFTRCHFEWMGRGNDLSRVSGLRFIDCTYRYIYGDNNGLGTGSDTEFLRCTWMSTMRNRDNTDHSDGVQLYTGGTQDGYTFDQCRWIQADGDAGSIAFICSSAGASNITVKNSYFVGRAATAWNTMGQINGFTGKNITFFLTMSGKVANNAWKQSPPNPPPEDDINDNVFDEPQVVQLSATTSANTMDRIAASGVMPNSGGWTITNSKAMGVGYSAITQFPTLKYGSTGNYEPGFDLEGTRTFDWSVALQYVDAFERTNNYHPVDNPVGMDYPNLSAAQIVATMDDILTPVEGGEWDGDDGDSLGALGFDGLMKTAA